MEREVPLSERIYWRMLVAYSEDYLQQNGAQMIKIYQEMYEDVRAEGRIALAWSWLRDMIPDFTKNVFGDRRERGQWRELVLVLLVFVLVLVSGLYGLVALAGGAVSLVLLGVHVAEILDISGVSVEEAGALILGDVLIIAMFIGIARGAKWFFLKVCSEGLYSEHV